MATIFNSHFTGHPNSLGAVKPNPREVEALGHALKNPEFRAMLVDYVKEVQDPANREQYMKEMTQMEAERGFNVTFLVPKPGYVIKTVMLNNKNSITDKLFINVCSDENVEDAQPGTGNQSGQIPWAVPFSTSKPRSDVDKAGNACVVYDVIFHPNVIKKTFNNYQFRNMVNTTALEGLESNFGIRLDRKRMRFPKLKFKGAVHISVIRKAMNDHEKVMHDQQKVINDQNKVINDEEKVIQGDHEDKKTELKTKEPKYVIKYRYEQRDLPLNHGSDTLTDPCRPSSMVIEITLPELSSARGVDLDVLEHLLTLESHDFNYKLVLKLPYPVQEDQGSAKFDKTLHTLNVTLPVKPKDPVSRLVSVDSGIGLEFDENEPLGPNNPEPPKPKSNTEIVRDEKIERSLPPYTCHIYEGLMVVTLAVRNVVPESLTKSMLENNQGYQLTFHTLGQGFVPFHYGFCLVFDQDSSFCSLDDLEVEVWDNNMILQLSLPKSGKSESYKVGCHVDNLGEDIALPQLEAFKEKCYLLGKKNGTVVKSYSGDNDLDSDDSDDKSKERHSSGESNDSAISFSEPTSPLKNEPESPSNRFLVIPSDFGKSTANRNLRGILKRPRCLSDSGPELMRMMSSPAMSSTSSTILEEEENSQEDFGKKSVRFNEVVQRQIYRTNSSILGQKHKNQKKAEQKRRKAARRASEGDIPLNSFSDESENDVNIQNNDSGVASSVDESEIQNGGSGAAAPVKKMTTKKNRGKTDKMNQESKVASRFLTSESNSDLIFNLDF